MRKLRPLAVVMNPACDLAGAAFLWALARDVSCAVIPIPEIKWMQQRFTELRTGAFEAKRSAA